VFRDIANGTKHRALRYVPTTMEVLVSAQPGWPGPHLPLSKKSVQLYTSEPKLKAVTADAGRHEVLRLAEDAVHTWETFLDAHGI